MSQAVDGSHGVSESLYPLLPYSSRCFLGPQRADISVVALRHQPPQRQLFQPEMSTRQTRQSTGAIPSPQPGAYANGAYGTSGAAMIIANHEPRTAVPSNMKPVVTPANNPEHFRQLRIKNIVNRRNKPHPVRGMMLPGSKCRQYLVDSETNRMKLVSRDLIYIFVRSMLCALKNQKKRHTLYITWSRSRMNVATNTGLINFPDSPRRSSQKPFRSHPCFST